MISPQQKIRLLVDQAAWFSRMGNVPAHDATVKALERHITAFHPLVIYPATQAQADAAGHPPFALSPWPPR